MLPAPARSRPIADRFADLLRTSRKRPSRRATERG